MKDRSFGLLNELCRKITEVYHGSKTTFEDTGLGQPEANVILQLSNSSYPIKLVSKEVGKLVLEI